LLHTHITNACVLTTVLFSIHIALAFLHKHILICKSFIAQLLAIDKVDILYKHLY